MPEEADAQASEEQKAPDSPEQESGSSEEKTPAAEATTASTDDTDWQQRYTDTQAEYTRQQQFLAAAAGRFGADAQRDALRQLDPDLELEFGDSEDDGYQDPDERFDRLEQTIGTFAEQQQLRELQEQEENEMVRALEGIEKKEGREFTEEELSFVADFARNNRRETGEADVDGAVKYLQSLYKQERQRYAESKKAPQAPIGSPGEEQIDLSDTEKRQEYMARQLAAMRSSE
jgi:hypothetical protein